MPFYSTRQWTKKNWTVNLLVNSETTKVGDERIHKEAAWIYGEKPIQDDWLHEKYKIKIKVIR